MRVFKQYIGRTSKPKVWSVRAYRNKTEVTWGQEGGKMQSTVQEHFPVNVGKANEKSGEEVAREFAVRQVLLKKREGYKEADPDTGELMEEVAATSITTFTDLPPNLRFYKPKNSMNTYLENLSKKEETLLIRKRDGEMAVAALGEDEVWRFYSSKMLPCHKDEVGTGIMWADRYMPIVNALESLEDIPVRTILLGELVADKDEDNLQRVGEVTRSLTPRAVAIQDEYPLWFCIWDVAYWGGKELLTDTSYSERLSLLDSFINYHTAPMYLTLPDIFHSADYSLEQSVEAAKKYGWEGFIVVDPDSGYGDKAISWGGKADRPKYCAKLKPKFEADFIARWDPDNGIGEWGKGKKSGGVGALFLYLWDEENQEEVKISKCGGGLTDENVKALADPSLYPLAVQVEFASWTDKGSLQFPQFLRVRDDKTPKECTLDQRPGG